MPDSIGTHRNLNLKRFRKWSVPVAAFVMASVGLVIPSTADAFSAVVPQSSRLIGSATAQVKQLPVTKFKGIDQPHGIVAGPDGALWFTNTKANSIGQLTTSGVVSMFTGVGVDRPGSITVGPDGALWFTNEASNLIGRITTSGVVSNFTDPSIDLNLVQSWWDRMAAPGLPMPMAR